MNTAYFGWLGRSIVAFLAMATLTAATARAELLAEIAERGALRVGTALNIPWAMRDTAGEPFGFEVDMAAKLATDLEVALELVEMPFAELLDALESGSVDMIAAGLSITPERARRVAFSDPYMGTDVGVVVRIADLAAREDIIGFDDPAVTVAAVAGTTTEIAATRNLPTATLQLYPTVGESITAFLEGSATVLVAETPVPELLIAENPEVFTVLPDSLLGTVQAFAVRPDEPRFLTYLDNWIAAYEAAGVLEAARQYWFGGQDWAPRLDTPLTEVPIEDDETATTAP
jgi:polar amino acid transport system substrate-binding protein